MSREDDDFVEAVYKKVKNREKMKRVSKELLDSGEHKEARDILHALLKLVDDSEDILDTLLQIAECDATVDRKIRPGTDQKIMEALQLSGKTCSEMRGWAEQHSGSIGIITCLYACKFMKFEVDANKALKATEACLLRASHEIAETAKIPELRNKAFKLFPLIDEMVLLMRGIQGANEDLQVLTTARCLTRIGYVLNHMSRNHDAITNLKLGREIMANHFGPNAPKHKIYSGMANNMGSALLKLSQYEEAAEYHRKAISEVLQAEDITDHERQEDLKNYRVGLEADERLSLWCKTHNAEIRIVSPEDVNADAEYKHAAAHSATRVTLEELRKMQDGEGSYPQQDDPVKAAVRDLENGGFIKKETTRKVLSYFESQGSTWKDVRRMALADKSTVSVVLHLYTCKLLHFLEEPEKVVKEIGESFRLVRDVIEETTKQNGGGMYKRLFLPPLREMLQELKEVNQSNYNLKALTEAGCLNKLGSICIKLSDSTQAMKYLTESRNIMQSAFSTNAPKYSLYATTANYIAYACEEQQNYAKSARYYEKALDDLEAAEDLSDSDKNERLKAYQKRLENVGTLFERKKPEIENKQEESAYRVEPSEKERKHAEKHDPTPKPDYPYFNVGKGIFVNHTKRLREGYDVFHGKFKGEDVAVKKFDNMNANYTREIDIVMSLEKHPNTVEYKDYAEWESSEMSGVKAIYLAMELCDKETLFEIAANESFSASDRISSLFQFTRGLCHIHRHGIIHGDLKPHNLLRSLDGGVIKVADFGISKKLDWGKTHLSFSSKQAGTIGWMPPEKILSKRYDIFSAGLIYYYVLSGAKKLVDIDTLDCTDAVIAKDLISRMIDDNPKNRPTAEQCLASPLFWDVEKKMDFVLNLQEHLSKMPEDSMITETIENQSCNIVGGDAWVEKLLLTDGDGKLSSEESRTDGNRKVIFDEAMDVLHSTGGGASSILSLLHFISHHIALLSDGNSVLGEGFQTKVDIWRFYDSIFPSLFYTLYGIALQNGYFMSTEEKLRYLCDILRHDDIEPMIENRVHVFQDGWLEKLILDKTEVTQLREKNEHRNFQYRVGRYSLYNKATSNEREDETDYNEKSLHSLLRFIQNRQKYFKKDGKISEVLFGDDTAGLWNFFYSRFPNMFDDIFLCVGEFTNSTEESSSSLKSTFDNSLREE